MLITQHQASVIEDLQLQLSASRNRTLHSTSLSYSSARPSFKQQVADSDRASLVNQSSASSDQSGCSSAGMNSSHQQQGGVDGGGAQDMGGLLRSMQQELAGAALENAKLASVNAELVQNLDSMNLLFSGVRKKPGSL